MVKKGEVLKQRCAWAAENELLKKYHDQEWGTPIHDDKKHFEMLILEGAQAGLNWITVLKKRENYRKLFKGFDPTKVAKLNNTYLDECLKNDGIIKNRLKVYSTRKNAIAFLAIQKEFGSFDKYIWQFVGGKQMVNKWKKTNTLPSQTEESNNISKDLKKRGMTFVGPTIIYAYMQAVGLVNDHSVNCWRYQNPAKPAYNFIQ